MNLIFLSIPQWAQHVTANVGKSNSNLLWLLCGP